MSIRKGLYFLKMILVLAYVSAALVLLNNCSQSARQIERDVYLGMSRVT